MNLEARLLAKLDDSSTDCWLWTGRRVKDGYGAISIDGHARPVHRVAYELWVGPIPEGLEVDHQCDVRNCIRPDHLKPMTHRENGLRSNNLGGVNARKTHCVNGHEFTVENTYVSMGKWGHPRRHCRECQRIRQRRYYWADR